MGRITTSVLVRGETRFDIVGQKLPYSLYDVDESISAGLVVRIQRYALRRLEHAGFTVAEWSCGIYTMDGDRIPPDRVYTAEFTNSKGGMIGVQGIVTRNGWPCLDHGLCIDTDRSAPPPQAGGPAHDQHT